MQLLFDTETLLSQEAAETFLGPGWFLCSASAVFTSSVFWLWNSRLMWALKVAVKPWQCLGRVVLGTSSRTVYGLNRARVRWHRFQPALGFLSSPVDFPESSHNEWGTSAARDISARFSFLAMLAAWLWPRQEISHRLTLCFTADHDAERKNGIPLVSVAGSGFQSPGKIVSSSYTLVVHISWLCTSPPPPSSLSLLHVPLFVEHGSNELDSCIMYV